MNDTFAPRKISLVLFISKAATTREVELAIENIARTFASGANELELLVMDVAGDKKVQAELLSLGNMYKLHGQMRDKDFLLHGQIDGVKLLVLARNFERPVHWMKEALDYTDGEILLAIGDTAYRQDFYNKSDYEILIKPLARGLADVVFDARRNIFAIRREAARKLKYHLSLPPTAQEVLRFARYAKLRVVGGELVKKTSALSWTKLALIVGIVAASLIWVWLFTRTLGGY